MVHTQTGTDLLLAARLLRAGELVAVPTETVYGLAANALDTDAVLQIYKVKQRPQFNPLIIHIGSAEQLPMYTQNIPAAALKLAEAFWPGPLTMLLPRRSIVPDLVTAGSNRVAIRMPAHPLTLQLLQMVDIPLAAPSANPSGYVSPTTATHVLRNLSGQIPYILDGGACIVGVESTIIGWNELQQPVLYRNGGLEREKIETVLGEKLLEERIHNAAPETPGQLKSHYATHTPLYLLNYDRVPVLDQKKKVACIRFNTYDKAYPKEWQLILSPSGTVDEAAANLFRMLREADDMKADFIVAEQVPNTGVGIAVNDRLERARHLMKN